MTDGAASEPRTEQDYRVSVDRLGETVILTLKGPDHAALSADGAKRVSNYLSDAADDARKYNE